MVAWDQQLPKAFSRHGFARRDGKAKLKAAFSSDRFGLVIRVVGKALSPFPPHVVDLPVRARDLFRLKSNPRDNAS